MRQPVVMPREVEQECYGHRESLDAKLIARAISEKRVVVKIVRQKKQFERLRRDFPLGRGEAAAIALALASQGAVVATDDRQAINACKLLRIPFITALTILVRTREKGLISIEESKSKLEALAQYGRYKQRTIDAARLELEGK